MSSARIMTRIGRLFSYMAIFLVLSACHCTYGLAVGMDTDQVVPEACLIGAMRSMYGERVTPDGINFNISGRPGENRWVLVASTPAGVGGGLWDFEPAPELPGIRARQFSWDPYSHAELARIEVDLKKLLGDILMYCGVKKVGAIYCLRGSSVSRLMQCYGSDD